MKTQKIKNVKADEVKLNFHLFLGLYVLIKMYLRGISSVSYSGPLIGKLQQAKVGERVAVEIIDPVLGKYIVVAVRKTADTGVVVTGWTETETDITARAKQLMEVAYQVIFDKGLSSWDVKKEKAWIAS